MKISFLCVGGLRTRGKLTIHNKEKRQNQEMGDPNDRKCVGLWFYAVSFVLLTVTFFKEHFSCTFSILFFFSC